MSRLSKLLDLPTVADRLGLSLHTIRRWASERRIPTVKLSNRVLVDERELERFVEARVRDARQGFAV
jgi:excisionase family DNA binding protein